MNKPQHFILIEHGKETGPFSVTQIQSRLKAGDISGDTICIPKTLLGVPVPLSTFFPDVQHCRNTVTEESLPPPIDEATHCHVFCAGKQHGPYMPQQIMAMWKAGTLTADTSIFPTGYSDWISIADFFKLLQHKNTSTTAIAQRSHPFGILLTVLGVIITIYFAALYDTSVQTDSRNIPGVGYVGGSSVVNLAKQQNRLIGVIVGISMSVIGIIVVFLPAKANES